MHACTHILLALLLLLESIQGTLLIGWDGNQYESVVLSQEIPYPLSIYTSCSNNVAATYTSCSGGTGSGEAATDPLCFDGALSVASANTAGKVWLRGVVSNYLSCNEAVVVSLSFDFGVQTVLISAGGTNVTQTIFDSTVLTDGVKPFLSCCQDLVAKGWNGSVLVEIDYLPSGFNTTLLLPPANQSVPFIDYPQLIATEISCDGVELNCTGPPSSCHINVPPTADADFSFWITSMKNSIGINLPIVELPILSQISTIVWIRKLEPNTLVGSVGFGFGDEVVDPVSGGFSGDCKITYRSLVGSEGAIQVIAQGPYDDAATCTDQSYSQMYEAFQEVLTFLDSNQTRTFVANLGLVDLASAYPRSDAWRSCKDLALSFFTANTTQVVTNSTSCSNAPGSPEWSADPCCNTGLQLTECCVPYPVASNVTQYTLSPTSGAQQVTQCISPTCLTYNLQNIAEITAQKTCSNERDSLLSNPLFADSPFYKCIGRVYTSYCLKDTDCVALGPLSKCDQDNHYCSIPCSQEECELGTCTSDPIYGLTCRNLSTDETEQQRAFLQCTLNSVDPYLAVLITQHLQSSSGVSLVDQFVAEVFKPSCVNYDNTSWIIPHATEEECAADLGYCPWNFCAIGTVSSIGIPCTVEFCHNATPADVCVFQYTPTYIIVSAGRPDMCQFAMYDTQIPNIDTIPTYCQEWGGVWAGPTNSRPGIFGSCYLDGGGVDWTPQLCYIDTCIPNYKNAPCTSYCYDPTKTTAASCPTGFSSVGGYPQEFYSWSFGGVSMGACVIESAGLINCTNNGYEWQPGRQYLPPFLNSQQECESTPGCWAFSRGLLTNVTAEQCAEFRCTSCVTGTEPSCASAEACAASTACNAPYGCKFENNINQVLGFKIACVWTPQACILDAPNASCVSLLADPINRWQNPGAFPTEASCESLQICNDGTIPNAIIGDNPPSLPAGFNERNETECTKCGGFMQPYYKWESGLYRASQFPVPLKWYPKVIAKPQWRTTYNPTAYQNMLDNARTIRLSSVLAAELKCQYGIEADLLRSVSCSCANTGHCNISSLEHATGAPIAEVLACETISYTYIGYSFSIVITASPENITDANQCMNVEVALLQKDQLDYTRSRVYDSLSLSSETKKSLESPKFVFNQNGVVVGQVGANGISITYGSTFLTSLDVTLCMPIPPANPESWELNSAFNEWGIAVGDSTDFLFEMVQPFTQNGTNLCVKLLSDPKIYIIAGLVENWEEKIEKETWTNNERGLIIFCVVAYLIVDVLAILNIIMRIISDTSYFAVTALLAIVILSSLGTTELLMSYTGAISDTHLEPLLVDLPTLMLLTCVTLIIVTWNEILQSGRKLESSSTTFTSYLPILFLLSLYLIYIALSIAASVTLTSPQETCATTEDEKNALTVSQKLSLSYKVIFAFWTLLLALAFIYESFLIYNMLSKYESLRVAVRKNIIASLTATFALLVLAAITIYGTTNDLENTTKLAFIITVLILPSYAIVYLFSVFSSFAAVAVKITATGTGSSKGTPSSHKGKSSSTAK